MKIVQLLGIGSLLVLVTKANSDIRRTLFTKSVFEKSSSSVTTKYSTSLTDIKSKYRCAAACSSDDLCTRFEFCSDKCTLYQSGSTCNEKNNEKTNAGCKCFRMKWMKYEDETCRCPVGYYGNGGQCCQHVIQDCTEGATFNKLVDRNDVITSIKPLYYSGEPFEALCNFEWGGFTVFQIRRKWHDATDFNTNWISYRNGFGTLHGNHWLGLEKLYHILQNKGSYELHIHLFKIPFSPCMLDVEKFNLEGESSNYTATFENVKMRHGNWCGGVLTSSLTPYLRPFSTYDHISYPNNFNCTGREESGWWFADDIDCSFSNPNSKRIDDDIVVNTANGMFRLGKLLMQIKRNQ